jgi:hypothetical protein
MPSKVNKDELAAKIKEIYPEFQRYDLGLDLNFNEEKNAWIATISHGDASLDTHLEEEDAVNCVQGVKCVYLGTQIGKFVQNYCEGRGASACKT